MQLKSLLLLIFVFSSSLFISAVPDSPNCKPEDKPIGPFEKPATYEQIVIDLQNMIKKNNWEDNFNTAITDARMKDVVEMENIKDLTQYYNFLNYFVRWKPTEDETGTFVYRMLCTMYFVLDQKTVKPFQSPIVPWNPPPLTELSQWIVNFANKMGEFLNSTESINSTTLKTFYTAENYNVDAYEIPEGGWRTFNEFFARKFLPGTRPIDGLNNTAVIVSAADSTFDGCWNINEKSTVILKGLPWSIEQLLNNSAYKDYFRGGKFMHAFLAPYDYHRQHAPVSGKVLEATVIQGQAYLEVTIQRDPKGGKPRIKPIRRIIDDKGKELYAPDTAGYQFCQTRGLIVIDSPIGKVAVLPIGMAQVSSVVLSVKVNDTVNKGDEISYFQFGGSDIVYVFEAKSNVNVVAEVNKHYRVGEQIAIAHI